MAIENNRRRYREDTIDSGIPKDFISNNFNKMGVDYGSSYGGRMGGTNLVGSVYLDYLQQLENIMAQQQEPQLGPDEFGSYSIPASDPTYSSGFDYARSIAGGMPMSQVIAPGVSYSPEQPMGYTQEQLNTAVGTTPVEPPQGTPSPYGVFADDPSYFGTGIGGVTIFDDKDPKAIEHRDIITGEIIGNPPTDFLPGTNLNTLPFINDTIPTVDIKEYLDQQKEAEKAALVAKNLASFQERIGEIPRTATGDIDAGKMAQMSTDYYEAQKAEQNQTQSSRFAPLTEYYYKDENGATVRVRATDPNEAYSRLPESVKQSGKFGTSAKDLAEKTGLKLLPFQTKDEMVFGGLQNITTPTGGIFSIASSSPSVEEQAAQAAQAAQAEQQRQAMLAEQQRQAILEEQQRQAMQSLMPTNIPTNKFSIMDTEPTGGRFSVQQQRPMGLFA